MTETQKKNQFQQSGRVKVVKGSILNPEFAGLRFVLNIANMAGKPESPLYPIFDKKWPKVKSEVRGWWATKTGAFQLGAINTVSVQSDIWVLSLLCQKEDLTIDTAGLEKCLKEVCKQAKYEKATVHVSTILTNSIPEMTNLLQSQLIDQGVSVSFYEELGA
jgi:hypothetical protein